MYHSAKSKHGGLTVAKQKQLLRILFDLITLSILVTKISGIAFRNTIYFFLEHLIAIISATTIETLILPVQLDSFHLTIYGALLHFYHFF